MLAAQALYRLAGDVVRAIDPHTEADNTALLAQFLIYFGSVIGRSAYFRVEAVRHYLNEYVVIAGPTSKARKGSSESHLVRVFDHVEPGFKDQDRQHGLSSGEGLIWVIRDAIDDIIPVKDKGKHTGQHQTVVTDQGVQDKRIIVVEAEFASTLRVMVRDGNTLSAVIRNAWDGQNLQSLVKNKRARVTDPNVSIVAHGTIYELVRNLDNSESANGFANRFVWVCANRSKALPDGGAIETVDFSALHRRIQRAVDFARKAGELKRDESARQLWHVVYAELSAGKPGLLGSMLARAEAHVMRLACLYALLDLSPVIREAHLMAALALA